MADDALVNPVGAAVAVQSAEATQAPKAVPSSRFVRLNSEYLRTHGAGYYAAWGEGERGLKYAIVQFLDGLISGAYDDLPAPHLVFCGEGWQLTLKLRKHSDGVEYIAFGNPSGDESPIIVKSVTAAVINGERRAMVEEGEVVHTSSARVYLEYYLRKFAERPDKRMIIVNFGLRIGELRIWKKPKGGYGIVGYGLRPTEELWNMHTES